MIAVTTKEGKVAHFVNGSQFTIDESGYLWVTDVTSHRVAVFHRNEYVYAEVK